MNTNLSVNSMMQSLLVCVAYSHQALADSRGLQYLDRTTPSLFNPDKKNQFPHKTYRSTDLNDVTDLASALTAIETIVTQGEGPRPGDPSKRPDKDHYDVFLELFESTSLKWDTYPVIPNPTHELYAKIDTKIKEVK